MPTCKEGGHDLSHSQRQSFRKTAAISRSPSIVLYSERKFLATLGMPGCAIRNSNRFGTAMFFTRMAASAGCIGFLSTNSNPAIASWGGRKKALGSNPWSIAAPAGKHAPMMLDIANALVARGKVYLAKREGMPIPLGWALTM